MECRAKTADQPRAVNLYWFLGLQLRPNLSFGCRYVATCLIAMFQLRSLCGKQIISLVKIETVPRTPGCFETVRGGETILSVIYALLGCLIANNSIITMFVIKSININSSINL